MRMQFYGKSSPNLVAGVLLVFSLIVLYNYWNVSTYNKDLAAKLHTLEQKSIAISRANAALQSNLEQTHEEKTNLQLSLRREEGVEKDVKAQLSEKDKSLSKIRGEVDQLRKDADTLRDEKETLEAKIGSKDAEISDLKERVLSLEAQIVEKKNANDELTRDLAQSKKALEDAEKTVDKLKSANGVSSSTTTNAKVSKIEDLEPVLLSDPAEQQMGPDTGAASPFKSADKVPSENNGVVPAPVGGEDETGGEQGAGVLPLPGGGPGNLDAAEDDGDHPLKEAQDDQSPDGVLSAKELIGVGPAPPAQDSNKNEQHDGVPNHHSGQDIREAAHLGADLNHNTL